MFKIFEKEKGAINLKLIGPHNGVITLCAVDERGLTIDQGNLISFHPDGSVVLKAHVNPALGLQLDKERRLIVRRQDPRNVTFFGTTPF